MTTPRVKNPSHRGGHDKKICYKCGEEIMDVKWVTKQTHNKRKDNTFRQYHMKCWKELFL